MTTARIARDLQRLLLANGPMTGEELAAASVASTALLDRSHIVAGTLWLASQRLAHQVRDEDDGTVRWAPALELFFVGPAGHPLRASWSRKHSGYVHAEYEGGRAAIPLQRLGATEAAVLGSPRGRRAAA